MSRVLEVWLLGQHVGQLAQVDGRLNFCYSGVGRLDTVIYASVTSKP